MQSNLSWFLMVLAPWRFPLLFRQMVQREVLARYRGTALGVAWAFITPLLMLAVYSLVLVGVFKLRWAGLQEGGGAAFALRLFAGLMVFNFFVEVLGRAAGLFVEQTNLVKKVLFPLELLPFVVLCSAFVHFLISLLILLVGGVVVGDLALGELWRLLLVLVVVLPLFPFLLGLSWLLASLGVYVRDLAQVVSMLVSVLMFLSPIFYPLDSVSTSWRHWLLLNPMTMVIENVRAALFFNVGIDWFAWGWGLLTGLILAWVGARVFLILRRGFADVL